MNGGVKKDALGKEDVAALKRGMVNLEAHVKNVQKFGVPVVVALNRFTSDSAAELDLVLGAARGWGARAALSEVWAKGGEGGVAVACELLEVLAERKAAFRPLYDAEIRKTVPTTATMRYMARWRWEPSWRNISSGP